MKEVYLERIGKKKKKNELKLLLHYSYTITDLSSQSLLKNKVSFFCFSFVQFSTVIENSSSTFKQVLRGKKRYWKKNEGEGEIVYLASKLAACLPT